MANKGEDTFASQFRHFNATLVFCMFLACLIATWFIIDKVGRRPVLLTGGVGMAIFMYIVGGLATVRSPTQVEKEMMVAPFILHSCAYSLSWAPVSYVVVSEAASTRVKEKTNLLACVISILTTFVTSFTVPYLLNAPYADLGGKIGFIYGSICWLMVVAAYLYIPELKGKSLEEVDQLFASGAPLRKFGRIETTPVEEIYVEETGKGNRGGDDKSDKGA